MRATPWIISVVIATLLLTACSKIPQIYIKNSLSQPATVTLSTHQDDSFNTETSLIQPMQTQELTAPWSGPYILKIQSKTSNFVTSITESELDEHCGGSSMRTCYLQINDSNLTYLPTPPSIFQRIGTFIAMAAGLFALTLGVVTGIIIRSRSAVNRVSK